MTESVARAVISTHGLTKRFPSGQIAVNNVDLQVEQGSVYGFLGPNGSGKTTTIRLLLGLISATAGEIVLLGQSMPAGSLAALPKVGALVEGPAFHPYLSGRANLERLDAVDRTASPRTSRTRINEVLERVGLSGAARKRYRQYSLGMKQRLGLAAALLQPRELLIVDEPTNGLDPQGTREVRGLIQSLAADGVTVLVSSHLLSEIEQVCTHIGIMSHGHLLTQSTRAELADGVAGRIRVTTAASSQEQAVAVLRRVIGGQIQVAQESADRVELVADASSDATAQVAPAFVGAGLPLLALGAEYPSLEDIFVRLTGEGFDGTQ